MSELTIPQAAARALLHAALCARALLRDMGADQEWAVMLSLDAAIEAAGITSEEEAEALP